MRFIPSCALILHVAGGIGHAQTFDELQIRLGAYTSSENGGEKPLGIWRSTGPIVIGKPTHSTYSAGDTCEAFAVSSDGSLREDATTAWKIEMTPTRVVDDAVTFRLRWVRFAGLRQQLDQLPGDSSQALRMPNEDVELTLRPGESWQVDSLRVPAGAKTVHGRPCGPSASIRVSVDTYPLADFERRLFAADLWLIERLANGTEAQRGHLPSLRGVPNSPFRFYFDSITDGSVSLDIHGILVARLEHGAMDVSVEARSRWDDSGMWRSVKSDIHVKAGETVELRLPKLDYKAGPFANREFSIRIRARQLR